MVDRCAFETIQLVHGADVREIYDKVVCLFGGLWKADVLERDGTWRDQRIVGRSEPVRRREYFAFRLKFCE